MVRSYLERVILGEERGVAAWLLRAALAPLAIVYCVGLAVYLAVYSVGLRKRHRLPVPVISVGNLTFGGTGKTPAVEAICRILLESGKRVTILSRGHGGSAKSSVIVSGGPSIRCDSRECGDEPMALARALPGVSVVVGKDRRESGELACRELAPDVIVLDDGLQFWQLHRDLDVVVMDASRPFGSGFVMPMGDLREPASGLRRAGAVLLTDAHRLEESKLERLKKKIGRLSRHAVVLTAKRKPSWLRRVGGPAEDLLFLDGLKVVAFSGIGQPGSFGDTLESLGSFVLERLVFPDHHPYTEDDLRLIESRRTQLGAQAVITTDKDYSRIGDESPIQDLYVLGIELHIPERSRLAERLLGTCDGARQASSSGKATH